MIACQETLVLEDRGSWKRIYFQFLKNLLLLKQGGVVLLPGAYRGISSGGRGSILGLDKVLLFS